MVERILVIKLGALGDWVLATGPFAAIRAHHPGAEITLLTAPAFAGWGEACGWFDRVWRDERPGWTRPGAWLAMRRRLADAGFARVYDLQTSDRSSLYFRLFPRRARPEWSGIAAGCSHPHANPARDAMHTLDRQAEQLAMAGITVVPPPSLDWLVAEIALPKAPYALLVPGGAPHRPAKRWPHYAALARTLAARGTLPVLIGAEAERDTLAAIAAEAPCENLCSKTSLDQLGPLARGAALAVGNDTGPMHIIAACGTRSVVLFSDASDPALCAPRGENVTSLQTVPLSALAPENVMAS
ncbi:MAG: glycosyltransferase family 9 protein, partial [Alphaproteobacteria bacterium]|nr:glycosyltransferase family 9 protein [Alphaproteobacteria bacterium]